MRWRSWLPRLTLTHCIYARRQTDYLQLRRQNRLGGGASIDDAGILNEEGNVLGIMPHPENLIEAAHGGADARGIFESVLGVAA